MDSVLISAEWLQQHSHDPNLILLDASVKKVVGMTPIKYDSFTCIPNSLKCDLDNAFHLEKSVQPHTMPTAEQFAHQAKQLGINNNSLVVIYDNQGIYSSPRAWWMFNSMGIKNVYVLDGGLPAWVNLRLPTSTQYKTADVTGNVEAKINQGLVCDKHLVLKASNNQLAQIIDARSAGRFNATAPEPRPGLRSGHIPHSINLPFAQLLENGSYKTKTELEGIFDLLKLDKTQPVIVSCGSGMTACIILLAAYQLGFERLALYDGSWSEWGADSQLPIE